MPRYHVRILTEGCVSFPDGTHETQSLGTRNAAGGLRPTSRLPIDPLDRCYNPALNTGTDPGNLELCLCANTFFGARADTSICPVSFQLPLTAMRERLRLPSRTCRFQTQLDVLRILMVLMLGTDADIISSGTQDGWVDESRPCRGMLIGESSTFVERRPHGTALTFWERTTADLAY